MHKIDVYGAVDACLKGKLDTDDAETDGFLLTLDVAGIKIPRQSFYHTNEFDIKDTLLLLLENLKDASTSIKVDLTTYKETQEKDAYKKDVVNKLEQTILNYTDKLKSLIFGVSSDKVVDLANIIYAYLAKNIEDFQDKFLPRLLTQYITNTLDVTKHIDYVNSYDKKEYTDLVYKTLDTEQSFDKTFDTAQTVFNGLYDRVASGELTKEEAFSYIIIYCSGLLDALREETGIVATPQVLWRMNNIALNMRKLLFTALETNDKYLLGDDTSEKYGGKIHSMNTLKYEYIAELGINNIYTYVNKNKMELDSLKLKLENSIRDVTKEGSIYDINNFKGLGALQAYIEDFKENILKEVYTVAHTTIPSAAFAKKTGVSGALINNKIDANKNIVSEVENELDAILTVGISLQDNVSKLKYILSSRALADLMRKSILSASENKLATFKENGLGKATLDVLQHLQVKIPEDCITLIINLQKIYRLLNPHSVQSSAKDNIAYVASSSPPASKKDIGYIGSMSIAHIDEDLVLAERAPSLVKFYNTYKYKLTELEAYVLYVYDNVHKLTSTSNLIKNQGYILSFLLRQGVIARNENSYTQTGVELTPDMLLSYYSYLSYNLDVYKDFTQANKVFKPQEHIDAAQIQGKKNMRGVSFIEDFKNIRGQARARSMMYLSNVEDTYQEVIHDSEFTKDATALFLSNISPKFISAITDISSLLHSINFNKYALEDIDAVRQYLTEQQSDVKSQSLSSVHEVSHKIRSVLEKVYADPEVGRFNKSLTANLKYVYNYVQAFNPYILSVKALHINNAALAQSVDMLKTKALDKSNIDADISELDKQLIELHLKLREHKESVNGYVDKLKAASGSVSILETFSALLKRLGAKVGVDRYTALKELQQTINTDSAETNTIVRAFYVGAVLNDQLTLASRFEEGLIILNKECAILKQGIDIDSVDVYTKEEHNSMLNKKFGKLIQDTIAITNQYKDLQEEVSFGEVSLENILQAQKSSLETDNQWTYLIKQSLLPVLRTHIAKKIIPLLNVLKTQSTQLGIVDIPLSATADMRTALLTKLQPLLEQSVKDSVSRGDC